MIETGKVLQNRYRIERQIGQGGMGAVYIATDERFGSTVAIKETLCMDDNFRKALEREARLLNSLKHQALPRVTDHFLDDNGQFIVMEYIPGEDMCCILDENGRPFAFETLRDWTDQLLDALEFLHTQSTPVIHRDIKPQNLKITPKGQIVLLDFGLAKGNPTDAGVQTAAKSIFGYSRNYASLEQIQGTGTDPRSDLYSLAATIYHLATGQAPEDALTRAMSVLSNQPDPLVPANQLNNAIPAGFAGILQRALDLNAGQRPSSAREMRKMVAEMERYADLAPDVSAAATVPNVDVGSHKTRLMPDATRQVSDRRTEAKTEMLPAYISEETAVRPGMSTDPGTAALSARRPLKKKLAYGAAGALLLSGCLAAGAYVYDPTMFRPAAAIQPETPPVSADDPPVPETVAAPRVSEPAGQDPVVRPPSEERPPVDKAQAPRQQNKTSKPTAEGNPPDAGLSLDDDKDLAGKTIYVGNIKIRDGRVETPDRIIDEKGVVLKTPQVPPTGPIYPPDLRNLTPAQRRRIQEARRKGLLPPRVPQQTKP